MNAGLLIGRAGLDSPELAALIDPVDPDQIPVRPAPGFLRQVWIPGTSAMAVPGMILIDPEMLVRPPQVLGRLIIHELIHIRQMKALGFPRFAYIYLRDYLGGRITGLGHREAYLEIIFEREARALAELLG